MSPLSHKIVRTAKQWAGLTATEKAAHRRVLEALSIMRDEGIPVTPAAKRAGTVPATVKKYAGPALRRDARGRVAAKSTDRLFRRLPVLTAEGLKQLDLTASGDASVVGGHWSAIGHGLNTGNWSNVAAYKGRKVRGHTLETDPDIIERHAQRGEVDFEDIYELTT